MPTLHGRDKVKVLFESKILAIATKVGWVPLTAVKGSDVYLSFDAVASVEHFWLLFSSGETLRTQGLSLCF